MKGCDVTYGPKQKLITAVELLVYFIQRFAKNLDAKFADTISIKNLIYLSNPFRHDRLTKIGSKYFDQIRNFLIFID